MARKIGSRCTAGQVLGRGSVGTVWLGEGPDGPVAIKLLREELAADQELVARFVHERAALLSLDHPRVVGVRDLVIDGNDLALVMDLIRGTDLRTRLKHERRLAPEAAVAIVAGALAAQIAHRDVKPENVLLDMQGPLGPGGAHPALLTDFGVARLVDAPGRHRAKEGARATSGNSVIGTSYYLAPEIIEGLLPRASVDVYALATVLYELLAGFTPFGGGHPGAARCGAAGAGGRRRLQPRHPHQHAGPDIGRAGRRRARHGPRPARQRPAPRRRWVKLGAAAAAALIATGVGGYLAVGDDDGGDTESPGVHQSERTP